jgi:hypothetical protein
MVNPVNNAARHDQAGNIQTRGAQKPASKPPVKPSPAEDSVKLSRSSSTKRGDGSK